MNKTSWIVLRLKKAREDIQELIQIIQVCGKYPRVSRLFSETSKLIERCVEEVSEREKEIWELSIQNADIQRSCESYYCRARRAEAENKELRTTLEQYGYFAEEEEPPCPDH